MRMLGLIGGYYNYEEKKTSLSFIIENCLVIVKEWNFPCELGAWYIFHYLEYKIIRSFNMILDHYMIMRLARLFEKKNVIDNGLISMLSVKIIHYHSMYKQSYLLK